MKIVVLSLLSLFTALACGGDTSTVFDAKQETTEAAVEEVALAEPSSSANAPLAANTEAVTPKIIREASLRFETQDLEKTHSNALVLIKKYHAYVQEDNQGKNYDRVYHNVVVRIPNAHFDAFITEIGNGVQYFEEKTITAQDVTEEFVDQSARLKAKKTLEERYLQLLTKATKVSEILEIEQHLAVIREEIEAVEGRLKYLQNRVSYSTITINYYKKVPQSEQATVSYGSKMGNAFRSGWNGISSFFIGLIYVWPFILILVGLLLFIRKRLKAKKV